MRVLILSYILMNLIQAGSSSESIDGQTAKIYLSFFSALAKHYLLPINFSQDYPDIDDKSLLFTVNLYQLSALSGTYIETNVEIGRPASRPVISIQSPFMESSERVVKFFQGHIYLVPSGKRLSRPSLNHQVLAYQDRGDFIQISETYFLKGLCVCCLMYQLYFSRRL